MKFTDFRREFVRKFVDYLLNDTRITPLEDFEINLDTLGGNTVRFLEGEERKLSRWIARELAKREKVHIEEELERELLSKLSTYQAEEASKSLLVDIDPIFYVKMRKLLMKLEEREKKKKVVNMFKSLVNERLPKIVKKTFVVGTTENFSAWEETFSDILRKLGESWTNVPFEESEILKELLLLE